MSSTTSGGVTPVVPVFFATTEGQTQLIAERMAAVLRETGIDSRTIDLGAGAATVDWPRVRGAIVGASLHTGRHQAAVTAFVAANTALLNARPTLFFSVSLSAASENPKERTAAREIAEAFPRTVGWTPRTIANIAGRLAYTKYGFLKRWMMKRIARKEGAPTDTSRDYELTDWTEVERLAREFAMTMEKEKAGPGRPAR